MSQETLSFLEQNKGAIDQRFFKLDLQEPREDLQHPVSDAHLCNDDVQSLVVVNTLWTSEKFQAFINYTFTVGNLENQVLFIFSDPNLASTFLSRNNLSEYLNSGRVMIADGQHIDAIFKHIFKDIRTPFYTCRTFLMQQGDPLAEQTKEIYRAHYQKRYEKGLRVIASIEDYYKSSKFKERLEKIKQGMLPKVYVCRTCNSTAVKKFSNAIAKYLKQMDCETYIHEECKNGQCDYTNADYVEILKQKPDLIVVYPNYSAFNSFGAPKVLSFQDIAPFEYFREKFQPEHFSPFDTIFLHYDRFYKELESKGFTQKHLHFHYLSADSSDDTLQNYSRQAIPSIAKVGILKTISRSLKLVDMIRIQKVNIELNQEELERIESIEQEVVALAKQNAKRTDQELIKLGTGSSWAGVIPSFFLQHLNVFLLEKLNQEHVPLNIMGRNWDLYEPFQKNHLGHASSNEELFNFFASHQINLSINNSLEIHQRIFEGAQAASFFLVYKLPTEQCLSKMPDDMVPGEHFDYFENASELSEKCQFYLSRPERCREIGENLKRLVEEKYSYTHLCKSLLEHFRNKLSQTL